ncbi:hypothetical protein [Citrobacter freundii]|uniref:hypothetical protein n=1 Tax=Citrobacter freundii TaxID=546 RepID=UPI001A31E7E4|nr:hypothetical protein [Citrobacter freundii]
MSELAIIEIVPDMAPSIYVENGLEKFLEQIRESVKEVPDLSTAKGRARIASLAAQVSRSKTAVEKPGRDYLRHLKEAVKPAEAELRRFVSACDEMRDEVRRPLTEWEAEQERIKAEEAAIAAEQRKAQEEADRIKREAEQKEAARLAEEKRISDEKAARAADVEHRRAINASAVQALIEHGIPEDWAKACVVAIARGKVPATTINY